MSCEVKSLSDRQAFWKTLFEEKKLAYQLASLATKHEDHGVTYDDMTQYGQIHVKVESGSALGDNFQSDTFIVTVRVMQRDSGEKTLSTFIKVLPLDSLLRESVCKYHVHQREINMYQDFFILLREMHRDKPIPLDVPDLYYSHIEDIIAGETDGSGTCTLLENLKAEGYLMADKVEGADLRHCHMALTSLAHYHALTLSAVRKWKDPATGKLSQVPSCAKFLVEEKTMFDSDIVPIISGFSVSIVDFLREIKRNDLVEWITLFTSRMSEVILVDTLESSGPLGCILHGDYWINNMLFKYVEGKSKPVSLKMVDFQTSRIGHPLSDVLYFLYTSTLPDLRDKHMLVLLGYYFKKLTTDLLPLGIALDDYTWQNFLEDYKKRSLMWMFMGVMNVYITQNKEVVSKSKPAEKVAEAGVMGESGMNQVEESIKNMMSSHKLSDNSVLSDRILRLIDEVKTLNDS